MLVPVTFQAEPSCSLCVGAYRAVLKLFTWNPVGGVAAIGQSREPAGSPRTRTSATGRLLSTAARRYNHSMKDALYVLDGYSLVYRSYFAMIRTPLFNPKGKNASAIYGFFRSLLMLFSSRSPSFFAVALDSTKPTFRHEMYGEYKATREKTPDDLKNEIPVIEEILTQLGVPSIRVDGFEADDIMATLAERCRSEDRPCYIISGDKDLLQLVDGPVRVLKPESGGSFTELDREGVYQEWGVQPEQILDYLSLVGDSSDNVPGVKGIGKKTAAALLGDYPTLEEIYANLEAISSKSQREKLESNRENAFLSKKLIALATEVELGVEVGDLVLPELNKRSAAHFFAAEGMRTLVRDLLGDDDAQLDESGPLVDLADQAAARMLSSKVTSSSATLDPSGAVDAAGDAKSGPLSGQGGELFGAADLARPEAPPPPVYTPTPAQGKAGEYQLVATIFDLDRWCSAIEAAGIVAFDSETTGLDSMTAEPVGFSFSVESGKACYVALHGPDGPVLDADEARDRIRRVLENPAIKVIGQNIKYDAKVLSRWGVNIANLYFDTMIAGWLLDTEGNSFSMDKLADQYLGYTTVHYDDVVPKAPRGADRPTFDTIDLVDACRYAAEDADVTFRLYEIFDKLLKERGFDRLFFETEMKLLPVLRDMEVAGIRLDAEELADYSKEMESELESIEREIYRLVGHEFNIGSTKQLQEVLFTERKLTPGKKTKTGYSTDTSVLQELAAEDPVPALVLRNRLLSKLKGTYVDALPRMINPDSGRVHTHFNVTGTATGRVSSNDPNLQNIPIRDEEGRRIRAAFVPQEGYQFVSADYSQIELVVLAHLSDDPGLKKAFADGVDVHRHTGSLIFGVGVDEVTDAQRRIAKTINFGVVFGMSAFRLSRDLQIPRKEADMFLDAYFATYPRIKGFIDETVAEAERTGYVETLLGRRRYLRSITNRNRTVKMAAERVAVNTPIQGSAADIMKLAMLRIADAMRGAKMESRMLLQVHDELIFECPDYEVATIMELLESEMTGAVELSIPLKVTVESGSSWGALH